MKKIPYKKKTSYKTKIKEAPTRKHKSLRVYSTKKQKFESVKTNPAPIKLVPVLLKRHKDRNGGHRHVIMETFDDKHVSVGISKQSTKGKKSNSTNYTCETDVLGSGVLSRMRRQGTVDNISNYHDPRSASMSEKDYEQAKIYAQRAKEKHLKKSKK